MTTIDVRCYSDDDSSTLHVVYDQVVVGRVPHCWTVTVDELAETLVKPPGEESEGRGLSELAVLVGSDGSSIGFIHLGIQAAHCKMSNIPSPTCYRIC